MMSFDPKKEDLVLGRYRDGSVNIEVHAETCEECEHRVRYQVDGNDGGGSAACKCTDDGEGSEACDPVVVRDGKIRALLVDALAEIDRRHARVTAEIRDGRRDDGVASS